MGKGPQRTGANASGNENYGLDSCEAHNVGFSPQEDRNRSKSAVGEAESREEISTKPDRDLGRHWLEEPA
jgi:hypothetical protein